MVVVLGKWQNMECLLRRCTSYVHLVISKAEKGYGKVYTRVTGGFGYY
jgi:hypothetical protein